MPGLRPSQFQTRRNGASEFRLASCMRLGQAIPFGKWIDHCDCGCQLDEEGYHLLTCKHGGGPVWSHNRILSVASLWGGHGGARAPPKLWGVVTIL